MKPGRPGRPSALRAVTMAFTLVLSVAGVLWAHVTLLRSSPAKDARLAIPPATVHLEFSETAEPSTSRIELVTPANERIALRPRRPANDSIHHLDADVPPLPVAGAYRLEWRVIGLDGHPVSGAFGFTIDSIPAPPA
jgi:copper transport protein